MKRRPTLDREVLTLVARSIRESVRGEDEAFSAFLSEVAGDPYLRAMPLAKMVRTRGGRRAHGRGTT
jgi:hypothetical protein